MGNLTTTKAKSVGPGRHSDGDGLILFVTGKKGRSWVLRAQVSGERKDIGLGSFLGDPPFDKAARELREQTPLFERPSLTLAEARLKAAHFRGLLKAGRNPVTEARKEVVIIPDFKKATNAAHEALKGQWAKKTADAFLSSLETHAFPILGKRAVNDIDARLIAKALKPIWLDKPMMARKVRQRIGTVINYAHAETWRETPMPDEAVNILLPRQEEGEHLASMPYKKVPAYFAELDERESVGRLALAFAILTAARSGEVRGATWGQIDREEMLWQRPAALMKGRKAKPHSVTLNTAALAILDRAAAYRRNDNDLIFPSAKGKPLSDMALSSFMEALPYTVHGFRSSFRDWAAEKMPNIPDPVAEAALSHQIPDKVMRAYKRTEFLDMRRKLLAGWGAFVAPVGK
jgi:integrase